VGTFAHEPHALAGVLRVKPGRELAQLIVVNDLNSGTPAMSSTAATTSTLTSPAQCIDPVTRSSRPSHDAATFETLV